MFEEDQLRRKIDEQVTHLDAALAKVKHGKSVSFPELVNDSRFEIELLMTKQEEFRVHEPGKAWRRKGWVVAERHLVEVVEARALAKPSDYLALLPGGLPETFTTADIAEAAKSTVRSAQQSAYCLHKAGLLVRVGKQGNAFEYRKAPH